MSTKCTIKWKDRTGEGPGYHLYYDCLDDGVQEPPVYLRLDGVHVEVRADDAGASVTVMIPTAIARELGLLSPNENLPGTP